MKKILLFTDSLGAGGAQRQLVGLAKMLTKLGYNITVATYFNLDFYKSQLDDAGIRNVLIPNADDEKKRLFVVRSFFKKEHPNWVIAYQETPSLVACMAKSTGCKFRLIVSERNTTQTIGINERVRFFLYRWADAIVSNSYAQGNFLTAHYPWMQKKLSIISNFVDLNHFNFVEKAKREDPEIVVAATIWASKNTLGFIEALKILADKGIKLHVSWYGKSMSNVDYFNQCLQKIEEYNLHDYISLKDKTKQIKQVYQDADFFCLPSFYEGTPNVICEALACGRPVVCSAVCDNPVYVVEGENGYLFDPTNPQTIADAIERTLKLTGNEYKTFCRRSRERAEFLLSEKSFVDKYIKIIEKK